MDYKTYALMAILLASIASVALVGVAYAQTTLTVETDMDSYKTGDMITVTGMLTATNINQPLLIQVRDPQGGVDRVDQFDAAEDGSYTYTFRAGGTMNTDGTYTVVVSYKGTTEEEATFEFDADDTQTPGGWKTINVDINGTDHEIEYKITGSGNALDSVTGNVDTISLTAMLSTQSAGTLSLRFDEEIFDADDFFIAFADEVPADDEYPAGPGAQNTINIDFEAGTEEIEIVGDHIIPEFGAIAAIVLAVAIVGIIVVTARFGKFNLPSRL